MAVSCKKNKKNKTWWCPFTQANMVPGFFFNELSIPYRRKIAPPKQEFLVIIRSFHIPHHRTKSEDRRKTCQCRYDQRVRVQTERKKKLAAVTSGVSLVDFADSCIKCSEFRPAFDILDRFEKITTRRGNNSWGALDGCSVS